MRKTNITCDRCGRTVDIPIHEAPEGWQLFKRQPMRRPLDLSSSITDSLKKADEICGTCVESFEGWWDEARGPRTGEPRPTD